LDKQDVCALLHKLDEINEALHLLGLG